jgi:hypothetical protein
MFNNRGKSSLWRGKDPKTCISGLSNYIEKIRSILPENTICKKAFYIAPKFPKIESDQAG